MYPVDSILAAIRIAKYQSVYPRNRGCILVLPVACLLVEQNLNNVVLDSFLDTFYPIGSRLVVLAGMEFCRS